MIITLLATILIANGAAGPAPSCDVPQSLIPADADLNHVTSAIQDQHHLTISVVGTGSSALPGPDGTHYAYPARLEDVLRQRLPGNDIKVIVHIAARQTAAGMVTGLKAILTADQPALVVWQTGTADALQGVEPDDFRTSLDDGVGQIEAAGADVDLVNMQFSPHTESLLDVSTYADIMHWVAQQHSALLFDRLGIMRYWSDEGTIDLYSATRDYGMARRVHECIGRALASQIIDAAHLHAVKMQTTR